MLQSVPPSSVPGSGVPAAARCRSWLVSSRLPESAQPGHLAVAFHAGNYKRRRRQGRRNAGEIPVRRRLESGSRRMRRRKWIDGRPESARLLDHARWPPQGDSCVVIVR